MKVTEERIGTERYTCKYIYIKKGKDNKVLSQEDT